MLGMWRGELFPARNGDSVMRSERRKERGGGGILIACAKEEEGEDGDG